MSIPDVAMPGLRRRNHRFQRSRLEASSTSIQAPVHRDHRLTDHDIYRFHLRNPLSLPRGIPNCLRRGSWNQPSSVNLDVHWTHSGSSCWLWYRDSVWATLQSQAQGKQGHSGARAEIVADDGWSSYIPYRYVWHPPTSHLLTLLQGFFGLPGLETIQAFLGMCQHWVVCWQELGKSSLRPLANIHANDLQNHDNRTPLPLNSLIKDLQANSPQFLQALNYIIDAYLIVAASAIAANTILRSFFGAGFPLFATQMFDKLGIDWAGSLLGFLAVAFMPIPFLFYMFGEKVCLYHAPN